MSAFRYGRRTIYRGVTMRSRLEATYAGLLDQNDVLWQYEPFCFADEKGQYLPDFRLDTAGHIIYVDVKPRAPFDVDDLKRRMEIIWRSERMAGLGIWVEGHPWYHFAHWRYPWTARDIRRRVHPEPFPGCHPVPDDLGRYYYADDPERPF